MKTGKELKPIMMCDYDYIYNELRKHKIKGKKKKEKIAALIIADAIGTA